MGWYTNIGRYCNTSSSSLLHPSLGMLDGTLVDTPLDGSPGVQRTEDAPTSVLRVCVRDVCGAVCEYRAVLQHFFILTSSPSSGDVGWNSCGHCWMDLQECSEVRMPQRLCSVCGVCVCGAVCEYGAVLQHFFIPTSSPSSGDVGWNSCGHSVGWISRSAAK